MLAQFYAMEINLAQSIAFWRTAAACRVPGPVTSILAHVLSCWPIPNVIMDRPNSSHSPSFWCIFGALAVSGPFRPLCFQAELLGQLGSLSGPMHGQLGSCLLIMANTQATVHHFSLWLSPPTFSHLKVFTVIPGPL